MYVCIHSLFMIT